MHRSPALLLIVALAGGLAASWTHDAHHALEWAEAQSTHDRDHHTEGDHATAPCVDGHAHALDCAVCAGLGGVVEAAGRVAPVDTSTETPAEAVEALADVRRAVAPARGPPAVA